MQTQANPDEADNVLGLLTMVAVDFDYIPLDSAELLLIHGLIEVREEKADTAHGQKTIEAFIPTQDAINFVAKVKEDLPADPGGASLMPQPDSLPTRGKRKWVVSQSYLQKWRSSGKRVLPKSIIRRWRPRISL
ncbi:hypothetical protein D3P04_12185 [Paracoccus onubensis]|uniref:Uncharacterized protein n=1 Tax=Paracoccus onubensis TaxID=1675788 RepID=A0A418SVV2_9RHOB|nr:hypothetical protein D3P04_12185 [Paracoccus onubensis]